MSIEDDIKRIEDAVGGYVSKPWFINHRVSILIGLVIVAALAVWAFT